MLNIKTNKSFISKTLITSLLCSIGLLTNIHAQAEETASKVNNTFERIDNNPSPNTGLNKNNQDSSHSRASDLGTDLFNHINKNWTPPINKAESKVSISIDVSSKGDVLRAIAYTSDKVLRDSIEEAIYKSSPITPLVGTNFRRIKLNFVIP